MRVGRADGRAGAGGREDIRIAVDRQAEQMVARLERTARTSDVAQQLRELAQALTQDEPQQGAASASHSLTGRRNVHVSRTGEWTVRRL